MGTAPGDRLGADGRYELVERIGSGGMGAVWRAVDHKLGCDRAVKVLDSRYSAVPSFVERFLREARAASRVAHPNVVAVLDSADEDERPVFLVMELLEGKTLSQVVKGNGRLPWAQVQRYIDQIAAGLGAAHAQDVVHRDVKPGNCLVLPDGQLKLLDFGIANVRDEARLTAHGEIIGTCSYMAPEQIRGQVDKRSDIYALGVLTFRLLAGRVPFSHREQDKVLLAHLTEPPPAPSSLISGLPAGVDDFVLRMLAKQPHQRFGSMDELRRVLEGIERGAAMALDGPTVIPPSKDKSHTAMFEDAPTRAVLRDSKPGSTPGPLAPVRVSLNTAPAGSGTLAQLEAQASPRLAGTMLLADEAPVAASSSGTVVVSGPLAPNPGFEAVAASGVTVPSREGTAVSPSLDAASVAAVPMGHAAVPPRVMTVPTPVPRPLAGLGASSPAPPRVTRFSAPGEVHDGGMMRGVVAALGGIALAAAVVGGWVVYKRQSATGTTPEPAPASSSVDADVAADGAAIEPGVAEPGDAVPSPSEEQPGTPGEAIEGVAGGQAAIASDGEAVEGAAGGAAAEGKAVEGSALPSGEPEGRADAGEPPSGDPLAGETKTKKRRTGSKPKAGETKQAEVTEPEPEPEPKPDASKKKPKDLRDPF